MGSITLMHNVPQMPVLGSLKLNWRFSVLLASLWRPNVSNCGAQHLIAHMSFSLFHREVYLEGFFLNSLTDTATLPASEGSSDAPQRVAPHSGAQVAQSSENRAKKTKLGNKAVNIRCGAKGSKDLEN